MKKRIFAVILAALMVVPFGMLSVSADAASVPAEPTATSSNVVYIAYGTNLTLNITPSENGGATENDPYKTNNTTAWDPVFSDKVKDGGTIVMVGKAYFHTDYTIPATTSPLVITSGANKYYASKYQGTDANAPLYDVEKAGQYCTVNSSKDANIAGQFGMFMFKNGIKVTIAGEVIFDDAVILHRLTDQTSDNPGSLVVANGGKLVIKNNVDFVKMGGVMDKLEVEEGGYAYLHTVGFSDYTGKGTIIIDKALIDSGKITTDAFANFTGVVADENGNVILNNYVEEEETTAPETTEKADDTTAPETTEKADDTTKKADETTKKADETTKKADETTKKADSTTAADTAKADDAGNNNAVVWIIVAVAAVAVVAVIVVVVVKKKKAE